MKLITAEQRALMLENGRTNNSGGRYVDFFPVVKLFTPDANATWLLTELDPDDENCAFGLCDLGLGCPELGYASLIEIAELRGCLGLPVERDQWFKADKTLSAYAEVARQAERIVT